MTWSILIWPPYEVTAKLLDNLPNSNHEKIKKGFHLVIILNQLDDLTKIIKEYEIHLSKKENYTPPHKQRGIKERGDVQIKETLVPLLQKPNHHHTILEELREYAQALNKLTTSRSMLIQSLKSQVTQFPTKLHQNLNEKMPGNGEANPLTGV